MTVTLEASRARCNEYYAANRHQIQAARKAKRLRARAEEFEQAVLLGRPIGHTIPVCGSALARVWHRSRHEVCGQCAYTTAVQELATTWVSPRSEPGKAASPYYEAHKATIRARNDAWETEHADQVREYKRLYAQRPEQRAKRAAWRAANTERMREYRRANRERVGREAWTARSAAWRTANLERSRALQQARKRADRAKGANDAALRRASARGLPAEPIDRNLVWLRDGGVCHLCCLPADPSNWHLDHVIPVAHGGAHLYDNVRVSHPSCNQRKGARTA